MIGVLEWDDALRAMVEVAADALEAGDEPAFRNACARIVRARFAWPIMRTLDLLDRAERDLEERVAAVEREPWMIWSHFADAELLW